MTLVSKDESLKHSMVNIGYLILKEFEAKATDRLSLAEISSRLRKESITHYRSIMFALIFLHSAGAIEFKAPYLFKV